jgi:hypothetical protein
MQGVYYAILISEIVVSVLERTLHFHFPSSNQTLETLSFVKLKFP